MCSTFEHRWGQIQDGSSDLAFFVTLREHRMRTRVFSHAPAKRHEYHVVASDNFPYWSAARRVAQGWPNTAELFESPVAEDASGWPFRSLMYRMSSVEKDGRAALVPFHGTYFAPAGVDAGIRLSDGAGPFGWNGGAEPDDYQWSFMRALPLQPIWLGFAANTLIYSVAFALFFWTGARIVLLTPWCRHRRGLCRRCAYDLRFEFDRGCPECGWNRGES